jgi:hypothetical protein
MIQEPMMISEPTFCITSDIDWASPFCTDELIHLLESYGITPTLFATHECPVVRRFCETHPDDVGVHPNFQDGSTHGSDWVSVIDHVFGLYPHAKAFRSHAFYDSSDILMEMARRGVTYDSNLCLYLQPNLVPLHLGATGMTRFPVFWEDDTHWLHAGGKWEFDDLAQVFASPGLKIINVHPFIISANIPSAEYYADVKKHIPTLSHDDSRAVRHDGPGPRTLLIALIEFVRSRNLRFYTLHELFQRFPIQSFLVC